MWLQGSFSLRLSTSAACFSSRRSSAVDRPERGNRGERQLSSPIIIGEEGLWVEDKRRPRRRWPMRSLDLRRAGLCLPSPHHRQHDPFTKRCSVHSSESRRAHSQAPCRHGASHTLPCPRLTRPLGSAIISLSRSHLFQAHSFSNGTDLAVEYYAQRAAGLPGTLLVTEATFIRAEAGA